MPGSLPISNRPLARAHVRTARHAQSTRAISPNSNLPMARGCEAAILWAASVGRSSKKCSDRASLVISSEKLPAPCAQSCQALPSMNFSMAVARPGATISRQCSTLSGSRSGPRQQPDQPTVGQASACRSNHWYPQRRPLSATLDTNPAYLSASPRMAGRGPSRLYW